MIRKSSRDLMLPIEKTQFKGKLVTVEFAPVYAYEWWGPNNNGDSFPWDEIRKNYKTFETHASVYLEHQQNDAMKVGYIEKAFLDFDMKRIVVRATIDLTLVPEDIISRVKNKVAIGSSMGCEVPYDICSACGHIARSNSDRCKHIPDKLLEIDEESNELVSMINISPIWYDLSIVARPAMLLSFATKYIENNKEESAIFAFRANPIKNYLEVINDFYNNKKTLK